MIKFTYTGFMLLSLGGLTSGCSMLTVQTDSYLGELPFPTPSTQATIFVQSQGPSQPALLQSEVARLVRDELGRMGYAVVDEPGKASHVVTCEFGTDQARDVVQEVPRSYPYYATSRVYDRHGHFLGTTRRYGSYRRYELETYREFDRHLLLTLLDRPRYDAAPEPEKSAAIVWQASVLCSSTQPDLRRVVRYLLAAAFEHFGEDTGVAVRHTYRIGDDDYSRFDPES